MFLDVDALIAAHDAYLDYIAERLLLEGGGGGRTGGRARATLRTTFAMKLRERLIRSLEKILEFCDQQEELYTSVLLATAPSASFGATAGSGRGGERGDLGDGDERGGGGGGSSEFEHYERLTAVSFLLFTFYANLAHS